MSPHVTDERKFPIRTGDHVHWQIAHVLLYTERRLREALPRWKLIRRLTEDGRNGGQTPHNDASSQF
jgi:hypothetical protein